MVQKVAGAGTEATVPPANQVIEKEPSGITLSELGKKYLDHMRASGRTEKHIRNVERLLDNQFVPVIGDKPVDALTYPGVILQSRLTRFVPFACLAFCICSFCHKLSVFA